MDVKTIEEALKKGYFIRFDKDDNLEYCCPKCGLWVSDPRFFCDSANKEATKKK